MPISEMYQHPTGQSTGQSSPPRQRICEFQSLQMLNSVKKDVNMGVLRVSSAGIEGGEDCKLEADLVITRLCRPLNA